jgi:MHS family proline/betaine transporter-like MFS transporter
MSSVPQSIETELGLQTNNHSRFRAMFAGVIGNVLEWYDFAVYAFLVPIFSKLFFPENTPGVAILLTLAVFGSGFVARPLGAVVFGHLGDKHGRRVALSAVMILMGLSTFAMGLLPTHSSVGVAAPILLVALRLVQGLSSGGEWGGSAAFVVEYAPERRRGLFGGIHVAGVAAGFLVGVGVVSVCNALATPQEMLAWVWRVPLLLGLAVAFVGFVVRYGMADTPSYREAATKGETVDSPLKVTFGQNLGRVVSVFGLTVHHAISGWVFLAYIVTYLTTIVKLPLAQALSVNLWALAVGVVLTPITGALSDRFGRRPVMITACVLMILFVVPAFQAMNSGEYKLVLLAQCGMMAILSLYLGPIGAALVECFPTNIRYSGLSVSYNVAHSLLGGFAPFIAQYLVTTTGSQIAPAYYVVAGAVVSLLVVLRTKETAFAPLE